MAAAAASNKTTTTSPREMEDVLSDGSDIVDEYSSRDEDDVTDPDHIPSSEPLDRARWRRDMFSDSDEDSDDDDHHHDDWVTDASDFNATEKRNFIRKPGVKVDLPPDATPLETFERIFDERMWSRLVTETNTFARQSKPEPAAPRSEMTKWRAVTLAEMKTFIGLCIAMGILRLPVRRDYWRQTKTLFQTTYNKVMSRDRFDDIWRFLHLQDNEAAVDRTDTVWKLRWFLDFLVARFQELYEVDGFVTVDESMVKFKGRQIFRQYLPLKPEKWGVKVWVMAESSTGYCTNFKVYTGREAATAHEKGLAHRVVMDLAEPFYGSQLAIFMDDFYTSPELFKEMTNHGLYGCGTVRANRKGLPKGQALSKTAPMKRHDFKVAQNNELTFCVWKDTKVMVLSNYHHPTARGTVSRRKEGAARAEVTVPACVSDYQKYMKGVDLMDQMTGYYQFQHRSKKWWRRVFFFFLSVSCHNAFIAARSVGGRDFKKKFPGYKDWVEDLTQELITSAAIRSPPVSSTSSVSASAPASPSADASQHDFASKLTTRRACTVCLVECSGTEAKPRRVTSGCKQCQVTVCQQCFGKHTRGCQ